MQLMAAIESIAFLPLGAKSVSLFAGSTYLRDGITQWVHSWKQNNWKKNNGTPVRNADLWRRLDTLCEFRQMAFPALSNSALLNAACDMASRSLGHRVEASSAPGAAVTSTIDTRVFLERIDPSRPILAFTDGACSSNPGPGGWGAVLIQGGMSAEISGGEVMTTNNQMELMASVQALAAVPDGAVVVVTTDSSYVKNGITSWVTNWKANGWRTSANTEVKNKELWTRLDALNAARTVTWEWVKGHSGHPQNERADRLAVAAIPKPV
jgi:ribonuclease HI